MNDEEAEMTRNFCPRCAIKHLAKAHILMDESLLGYPFHVWYAMGNMSEAEDEIVEFLPEQAAEIRKERLKIQEALSKAGTYMPRFKDLMYSVAQAAMLEEVEGLEDANQGGTREKA